MVTEVKTGGKPKEEQNSGRDHPNKRTNPVTFGDFDKLNLKAFGENLFEIMEKGTSSLLTEGAYTISLNADFGNGKTTFLKMFENFVKKEKSENYNVLFINAWESDFSKEPVIAILSEFVNWIEGNDKRGNEVDNEEDKKNSNKKIKDEISEIVGKLWNNKLGIVLNTGNQAVKIGTGVDIKEAISSVNDPKDSSQKEESILGKNLLKDFNQRKQAIKEIKNVISDYIEGKKLLVIVDELDRTRPDYAVSFLEDMKHFFDIKNVVFLFAVNRGQIEETAKCLYGQEMDFNGYYRKFFKQEIDLPDPYREAQNFIDNLMKKTILAKDRGQQFYVDITENVVNELLTHKKNEIIKPYYISCKMFQLTLREIELFINIFEKIIGSGHRISVTCTFARPFNCFIFLIFGVHEC